ncbi:MAG: thiamine pyrophosphate-binding protein [Myxococcota bacterium]
MHHGGREVARALAAEGATHVFTLCGGHIQNIYDGCLDEGIRVVDVRHEQTAGHAADGWARVTGKPGVALVTAGPGVTDVVTAAANAHRAGVPMLIIGGAGPTVNQHQGSLQDMDHVELMRPITKWSARVNQRNRVGEYVRMAFRHAMTGVPGPVFLELPLDVLMIGGKEKDAPAPERYRAQFPAAPDPRAVERAAALLAEAERPMLVVGSQLRWSADRGALARLVKRFPVPTFVNGMARGALRPEDPCFLKRTRSWALKKTDLLLLFGTPFDFRMKYGKAVHPDAKVVQVDLDGAVVAHNKEVDVGAVGDTGLFLAGLEAALPERAPTGWLAEVRAEETTKLDAMAAEMGSDADPPNPLRVCAEVARFVEDDSVVVGDGGDFVATAAYTLPVRWPGVWMDPGPLGTLGVGPGYAMAAKLARPGARVILMYGDGSFGLHGLEFEAFARQGIKVVGVVGNDAGWTQILRGQRQIFGEDRVVATQLAHTRYDRVVEACGGRGFWVESCEGLRPALEEAFACPEPALVNVKIGASDFRKGAISV